MGLAEEVGLLAPVACCRSGDLGYSVHLLEEAFARIWCGEIHTTGRAGSNPWEEGCREETGSPEGEREEKA